MREADHRLRGAARQEARRRRQARDHHGTGARGVEAAHGDPCTVVAYVSGDARGGDELLGVMPDLGSYEMQRDMEVDAVQSKV